VTVAVPEAAEVFFDGVRMTLTGPERIFYTPTLEKGTPYHYDVRARWTGDGVPVEQTRRVVVRAGDRVRLDFLSPMP
jgi:uncharacterized protein (TIGR03000 family)